MNLSIEIQEFVRKYESEDIHSLALQAKQFPDIDFQFAIQQIAGRQIAKEKIPAWYANSRIIYSKHLSLEQCSSEQTACFKASLCQGESMVDLTGGFGVDFSFLANNFKQAVYVEQQEDLSEIAESNFQVLDLNHAKVVNADAIGYISSMSPVDLIYIDPARRNKQGRKTVLIEDCTPNILEIESLLEEKSKMTMIKLSPMLDISLALKSLKGISDVYIISVGSECKELLFIKKRGEGTPCFHCVNLKNDKEDNFTFYKEDEEKAVIQYTSQPKKYLYEPNASILKGGAYKSIAKTYCLEKLHPNSHLYTSDTLHSDFQGRTFVIEGSCSLNKKELKTHLTQTKQANITVRNFPLSVQEIRKKTGLKDGSNTYIFATTLADEKKVLLICNKA